MRRETSGGKKDFGRWPFGETPTLALCPFARKTERIRVLRKRGWVRRLSVGWEQGWGAGSVAPGH